MIYKNVNKFLLNTIILFMKNKHYYNIKEINNNTYELNISKEMNNTTIDNIIKQINKLKSIIENNYKNNTNKIKIVYDKNIINLLIYYMKENNEIIYNLSKVYYYNSLFLNINNNKIELSMKHINKEINIIDEINKNLNKIIEDFKKLIIN